VNAHRKGRGLLVVLDRNGHDKPTIFSNGGRHDGDVIADIEGHLHADARP
jgi:hypothetical protein